MLSGQLWDRTWFIAADVGYDFRIHGRFLLRPNIALTYLYEYTYVVPEPTVCSTQGGWGFCPQHTDYGGIMPGAYAFALTGPLMFGIRIAGLFEPARPALPAELIADAQIGVRF
jgi:hypothetical protein